MKPLDVLKEQRLLNPSVLAVGLERGWIERRDVADFAVECLLEGDERPEIVELASCERMERRDVLDVLGQWRESEGDDAVGEEDGLRHWIYGYLKVLSLQTPYSEDTLDELEALYAMFGYPSEMRKCSRYYIPPEDRERRLKAGDRISSSPEDSMLELLAEMEAEFAADGEP